MADDATLAQYDNAVAFLAHVKRHEESMLALHDRATNGYFLNAARYDHSVAAVKELISELWHSEIEDAKARIEQYESQDGADDYREHGTYRGLAEVRHGR